MEAIDVIAGYALDAEDLIPRYEALRTPDVLAPVFDLLPRRASRMLDVGAGTGRDSAWLASRGHEVLAVEPAAELRRAGMELHRITNLTWLDDRLPFLSEVAELQATFDLVLAIAVWQHLRPGQQAQAMATLARMLAPDGRIIISIRHGPGAPRRPCFPADVDETIREGEGANLTLLRRRDADSLQRENRDAGVRWTWLCMERG